MKKYLMPLFFCIYSFKAVALIEVDITRGNLDPLPIAISPLHVDIKSEEMKENKVTSLVVIENEKIVGVVTINQLLFF